MIEGEPHTYTMPSDIHPRMTQVLNAFEARRREVRSHVDATDKFKWIEIIKVCIRLFYDVITCHSIPEWKRKTCLTAVVVCTVKRSISIFYQFVGG